ncbi:alpha/beta hydrolase [Williamsia sp. SKLECPSW1]
MTVDAGVGVVAGWSAHTHRLDEIACAIDTLVDRCDERIATVVRAMDSTLATWTGTAADAQRDAVQTRRAEATRVAMGAQEVVAALRRRGPDLAHTSAAAAAFHRAVSDDGYRVVDDHVDLIPGRRPRDVPTDASPALAEAIATTNAGLHTDTLQRLVAATRGVDRELAADLDAAAAHLEAVGRGTPVPRSSAVSPPIGPPDLVAHVWRTASVDQRAAWAAADPLLGNRPGVPVADRDRLNRTRLSAMRVTTAAERALRRRLATPGRYLLTLRDDGRAVVAVGDPDVAQHVAVFVPGTGTTLASLGANLERADAMRDAAGGGSGAVSVVVWQDFTAPADLVEAAGAVPARAAAPGLATLLTDLRATHLGEPAHQTVIGHSYGSTVVGVAASGPAALDAGDVVLVASPGAGSVSEAGGLHLAGVPADDVADHVWAVTAGRDPIRLASPYVLGRDPTSPLFGAQQLPAAPGSPPWDAHSRYGAENHSGYWDPGSPTLAAMGAVIAGRADR